MSFPSFAPRAEGGRKNEPERKLKLTTFDGAQLASNDTITPRTYYDKDKHDSVSLSPRTINDSRHRPRPPKPTTPSHLGSQLSLHLVDLTIIASRSHFSSPTRTRRKRARRRERSAMEGD